MTDSQEIKQIAEELVSLFKQYWASSLNTRFSKFNSFSNKLIKEGLIIMSFGGSRGCYAIRRLNGEPVFIELGELFFLNLDLARAVKEVLSDQDVQILQIIE